MKIEIIMKSQREIEAMLTSKNMKLKSLNDLLVKRGTDRNQVENDIKTIIIEIGMIRNILNR